MLPRHAATYADWWWCHFERLPLLPTLTLFYAPWSAITADDAFDYLFLMPLFYATMIIDYFSITLRYVAAAIFAIAADAAADWHLCQDAFAITRLALRYVSFITLIFAATPCALITLICFCFLIITLRRYCCLFRHAAAVYAMPPRRRWCWCHWCRATRWWRLLLTACFAKIRLMPAMSPFDYFLLLRRYWFRCCRCLRLPITPFWYAFRYATCYAIVDAKMLSIACFHITLPLLCHYYVMLPRWLIIATLSLLITPLHLRPHMLLSKIPYAADISCFDATLLMRFRHMRHYAPPLLFSLDSHYAALMLSLRHCLIIVYCLVFATYFHAMPPCCHFSPYYAIISCCHYADAPLRLLSYAALPLMLIDIYYWCRWWWCAIYAIYTLGWLPIICRHYAYADYHADAAITRAKKRSATLLMLLSITASDAILFFVITADDADTLWCRHCHYCRLYAAWWLPPYYFADGRALPPLPSALLPPFAYAWCHAALPGLPPPEAAASCWLRYFRYDYADIATLFQLPRRWCWCYDYWWYHVFERLTLLRYCITAPLIWHWCATTDDVLF